METLLSRDLVSIMGLSREEKLERKANTMMRDWKQDEVNAVAWSSYGKCIASGSSERTVQVWETP